MDKSLELMAKRPQIWTTLLCILVLTVLLVPFNSLRSQDRGPDRRAAAFAGTFYPADKDALVSQLEELFGEAAQAIPNGKTDDSAGIVQTIIVPHAGYDYSGMVSAAGYLSMPRSADYKNIFIITTSHRQEFEGISICKAGSYGTPLGDVQVNRQIASTLINQYPNIIYRPAAHEREQGIEVQLPFIQYHFHNTPPVVPIVLGSSSLESARELATALMPWFTPENLFIISADFSRYPSYKDAVSIDKSSAAAVMSGNPETFYNTLRNLSNSQAGNLSTPCGDWSAIMTLLYMGHHRNDVVFNPMLYRNSGDSPLGNRQRVVGYWAIKGEKNPRVEETLELTMEEKTVLLKIARSTLESYSATETIPEVNRENITPALKKSATILVSLYLGDRERGRLEILSPAMPLIAFVQEMTIASATLDDRFAPVEHSELEYINIEISVLTSIHRIESIDEIDPANHGIYMVKDGQSGIYLPGRAIMEGWSTEELLGHCAREKAALDWDDWKDAELYIFEAITFSENELNPSLPAAL